MKHELVIARGHGERANLVDATRRLDNERRHILDGASVEQQDQTARTVERGHFEAEGCGNRPVAGVHDRPRRVGSHPSPRPLGILLARVEPRHRFGIDRRCLRHDRQHQPIVETRGGAQSVGRRTIFKPLRAGWAPPHEQMRVTIRRKLVGQVRVVAVTERTAQQRHAIARQPLN